MSQQPRVLVAAASSGAGKTTAVCSILQALVNRGLTVTSFKCGPDYIDPMFHTRCIGAKSRNLDLFFTDENTTRYLLAKNAEGSDVSVIEGVMGYYDGVGGTTSQASAYHLASVTGTPVILVVGCKGMSVSIAAQIQGFRDFRSDSNIQGVLLNNISPMLYPRIKELVEREVGIPVVGYLPVMKNCSLESRHLGLVTADEIGDLKERLQAMGAQAEESIDLDAILAIAKGAPALEPQPVQLPVLEPEKPVRVAVARDNAFCFYYADSLNLLEELGAELVPFSPLADHELPPDIDGLLMGGGYPELYAETLAENEAMRTALKTAIGGGLPTVAECGGFMYLHETIKDAEGKSWPMVGVIEGESYPTGKLSRFGYVTLTAKRDTMLCREGEQIAAHEFHYWDSTSTGDAFSAKKPASRRGWECIHSTETLFAGYPHVHWYANPRFAAGFVSRCRNYRKKRSAER